MYLLVVLCRGLSLHKRSRLHFLHACTWFQRRSSQSSGGSQDSFILRLANAPREMDSQPVIRAGSMVTTSNAEVTGVVLNITKNRTTAYMYISELSRKHLRRTLSFLVHVRGPLRLSCTVPMISCRFMCYIGLTGAPRMNLCRLIQ